MLLLRNSHDSRTSLRRYFLAATVLLARQIVFAQSYSGCNPIEESGCPADPALGGATNINFQTGASKQFTASDYPTYSSDGALFTISQPGDAPTLISTWYIMFGKYESDDLDEIDWEFVGKYSTEGQTNYFGKGQATSWPRAGNSTVDDTHDWHTYGVEWSDGQLVWSIDGSAVRTLDARDADGQYPQTPCRLKIGAWSGGDPSNAPGTIQWAGGPTNYADGPFTMKVRSVSVVDYSTGSEYSYSGDSGSWTSIETTGGRINGNVAGSLADSSSTTPTRAGPVVGRASESQTVFPLAKNAASAATIPKNLLFSIVCVLALLTASAT